MHLTTLTLVFKLDFASPNFLTTKVRFCCTKFWFLLILTPTNPLVVLDLLRRVYTTLFFVAGSMLYLSITTKELWLQARVLGSAKNRYVFILWVHISICLRQCLHINTYKHVVREKGCHFSHHWETPFRVLATVLALPDITPPPTWARVRASRPLGRF